MKVSVSCSGCGHKYALDIAMKGKKVRCKECQTAFVVQPEEPAQPSTRKQTPPAQTPTTKQATRPNNPKTTKTPSRQPVLSRDDSLLDEPFSEGEIGLPDYQPPPIKPTPQKESGGFKFADWLPGSKLNRRDWKKARPGYLMMGIPIAVIMGSYLAPFPVPFMPIMGVLIIIAALVIVFGAYLAISNSRNVHDEIVKSCVAGGLACLFSLNLVVITLLVGAAMIHTLRFIPESQRGEAFVRSMFSVSMFHGPVCRIFFPGDIDSSKRKPFEK